MDRFETFTNTIAKISRNIKRIKSNEMQKFNLKTPHVSCLYFLYKKDGSLTAKELCDVCDEDKAAISRSIEHLEKENFIKCDHLQLGLEEWVGFGEVKDNSKY